MFGWYFRRTYVTLKSFLKQFCLCGSESQSRKTKEYLDPDTPQKEKETTFSRQFSDMHEMQAKIMTMVWKLVYIYRKFAYILIELFIYFFVLVPKPFFRMDDDQTPDPRLAWIYIILPPNIPPPQLQLRF